MVYGNNDEAQLVDRVLFLGDLNFFKVVVGKMGCNYLCCICNA